MKLPGSKHSFVLALVATAVLLFHSGAFAIGPAYSGSWYNPEQSGHGFSLEYSVRNDGTPLVLVYWYVYDTEGNPIFLVGIGEPEEGNTVTLEFQAPYGMKFGEFDPEQTVRADGGIGVFTFEDPDSGVFDYQPSEWIANAYGVSAISTPVKKLIGVAHPNPEIVELHIGAKLLTTTAREGDFPVCFNGAGELLPCKSNVQPPPQPGEPVPLVGLWSGRMVYDRDYVSTTTCYDADVLMNVTNLPYSSGGVTKPGVDDITVNRDGGSTSSGRSGSLIENNYVAGGFTAFSIRFEFSLRFNDYGQAEGTWRRADTVGGCYGTWSFFRE